MWPCESLEAVGEVICYLPRNAEEASSLTSLGSRSVESESVTGSGNLSSTDVFALRTFHQVIDYDYWGL